MTLNPFVINGELWNVVLVNDGDDRLVDRTGIGRLATTDYDTMSIYLSASLTPPLLDQVVLHEITHAITMSYRLLRPVRRAVARKSFIDVEEWSAQLVENHAIEAIDVAKTVLGRPLCIRGLCA